MDERTFKCIPVEKCRAVVSSLPTPAPQAMPVPVKCDVNETYTSCASNCGPRCLLNKDNEWDYINKSPFCTTVCANRCECKKGYIRTGSVLNSTCMLSSECPAQATLVPTPAPSAKMCPANSVYTNQYKRSLCCMRCL